jgi:hypothetical protein
MTFSITMLSITSLTIMTFSNKWFYVTFSITILSTMTLCHYAECHCAACRGLFFGMLNVIMLIVVLVNVVMLSVVAPYLHVQCCIRILTSNAIWTWTILVISYLFFSSFPKMFVLFTSPEIILQSIALIKTRKTSRVLNHVKTALNCKLRRWNLTCK